MKPVNFSQEAVNDRLSRALLDAKWGTIAPEGISAAKELAALVGCEEGLLVSCPAAAAEAILRALEIGPEDEVILPAYGSLFLKNAVEAVGAKPIFCEIDELLAMSAERLTYRFTPRTRAVFCEEIAGYPAPIDAIRAVCNEHDVPLIDVTDAPYATRLSDKPTALYADFCVCILPIDGAGAVLTDSDCIPKLYAAHHCGNPYGTAGGLNTGVCLGGDMRIEEWRSAVVREYLTSSEERRRMANSVKCRLWEALTARGITPISARKGADTSSHFLMVGTSADVEDCSLGYVAHTEEAARLARGVKFVRVI